MKIVAHRGNRMHAPENTIAALISAYTAGADALDFGVQLTGDGELVVAHDGSLERLAGKGRPIIETDLSELRELDVSETFSPRGAEDFEYKRSPHSRVQVETLPGLLDALPEGVEKLIELGHDSTADTGRAEELVDKVMGELRERGLEDEVIVYSRDPVALRLARERVPYLRICTFDWDRSAGEQIDLMEELHADGLVVRLDALFGRGQLNEAGERLARLYTERDPRVGAVVFLDRDEAVFTEKEFRMLRKYTLVYAAATDSMLDVASFARHSTPHAEESFEGKKTEDGLFVLGTAKANRYAHVFQDDGVHVKIDGFDEDLELPKDPVERRLAQLEQRLWFAEKSWPWYSGGGVGLVPGIEGDFVAEVEYEVDRVGQGSTLELAVLNTDVGDPPARQDPFFDPHASPPFAGVEHDEDDGYRINWNLGIDYEANRYGRPVGDGKALSGTLRLERRGAWFSAYYKNDDAPDWVCAGVTRNDSLNPRVFLRCAGKRWRQQREDDPDEYYPVAEVEFVFRNLVVTRHPSG